MSSRATPASSRHSHQPVSRRPLSDRDGYWANLQGRLSRRRVLAVVLGGAAGALALVAVACDDTGTPAPQEGRGNNGRTPKAGGTLTLSIVGPFGGVDPHNSVYGGATLVPLGYNYLVRTSLLAPQEGVIQDLASSHELLPDQVTTVFKIRPGVAINPNGTSIPPRALDAEDAKLSFERVMDPRTASNGFGWMQEWIERVDAPDGQTLRIITKAPFAWVLNNAGNNLTSAIVPREWLASPQLRTGIVGGGPFLLKEITEGTQAVMERNPAYWRAGQPRLDRLVLRSFADPVTQRTAFLSGQIDEYAAQNPDEAKEVAATRKDAEYRPSPTLSSMVSFWMNIRVAPWNDARVRRAVLRATDRHEYIQLLGRGSGHHVGLVSPFLRGYAPGEEELKRLQPYDIEEARRLFQAAAVKELSFAHPASVPAPVVNIFVRQMEAAGVTAKPDPMDPAAWVASIFQSKLSASLTPNQEYANPDLALHFHVTRGITGTGSYDTAFSDPEVDAAVRRAAGILDESARMAAYLEVQRLIYRKDPAVFFLTSKELDLLQVKALNGTRPGVGSLWTAFAPDYWLDRA